MRRPRATASIWVPAAILLAALAPVAAADGSWNAAKRAGLVWHVETVDGEVVTSNRSDLTFNPASVVKVATTLRALERLGPYHRFETHLLARGEFDAADGTLEGDLVAVGYGDPDFQVENAFEVAARLNEIGLRRVRGRLLVRGDFWIGWEGGSERRLADAKARAELMAGRLRAALDPRRWNRRTLAEWRRYATRRGIDPGARPRVEVVGGIGVDDGSGGRTLAVHRSKPLEVVLRRFNCYSNNDIERLEPAIGHPDEIAAALRERWGVPETGVTFETLSGLGTNRMTPRLVVRMLRDLLRTTSKLDVPIGAVLPVAGCDPGTLRHFFPELNGERLAGTVVGKTGTLHYTDDGTSVFAGIAHTADGDVLFCVAMPRAGRKIHYARRTEEDFVVDLIARRGGPRPGSCRGPLPPPDDGSAVFLPGEEAKPIVGAR